jgi:hypothetical protein
VTNMRITTSCLLFKGCWVQIASLNVTKGYQFLTVLLKINSTNQVSCSFSYIFLTSAHIE